MPTDGAESLPRCRELEKLQRTVKKLNFNETTHFYEVLGMPAHHLWMVPKHSHGANNMKNGEKLSENRNLIEMTHLLMVLGMPDHHPTLPV